MLRKFFILAVLFYVLAWPGGSILNQNDSAIADPISAAGQFMVSSTIPVKGLGANTCVHIILNTANGHYWCVDIQGRRRSLVRSE